MPGISPDKDRTVIPRWRTFGATLRLGELDSIRPSRAPHEVAEDFLSSRLLDWQAHRSVGHASDLVGAALAVGQEDKAADAAAFLLDRKRGVSPWAAEIAQRVLHSWRSSQPDGQVAPQVTQQESHAQVRRYRNWLRTEPRDSIAWVDLARAYAVLGLSSRAARCMTVAVQLATDNRFVLRAASRLWIHLDDPEQAHHVLARAEETRHDPWLLAAEIATCSAAGKPQKFAKVARQLLTGRSRATKHLSELASAVATLELESGSTRKSRRLFDQSLESPTENSIAQAAWASRRNAGIHFDDSYLNFANTFEARSWMYFERGKWPRVVQECRRWQLDQPFSSRPSVHGSYVSSVALQNYEESERFAKFGLAANPANFTLLNNLAFAQACAGKAKKAKEALSRIEQSKLGEVERAVFLATGGLLAFRSRDFGGGRRLYDESLRIAQKIGNLRLYALAAAFYAVEEARVGATEGRKALEHAQRALRRFEDPIFELLKERLDDVAKEYDSGGAVGV